MTVFDAEAFDVAVIGAGHAGIEAALASARLGAKTACFSINLITECLVIGLGVAVMLKNKQEDIILRKWKAENI